MSEITQLKKLMEAVQLPSRTEPWEENVEEFLRDLRSFANELPDAHYRDWLLDILKNRVNLMAKVKEFAGELSDSHYSDWLLQIASEFNNEAPVTGVSEAEKFGQYDYSFEFIDRGGEPGVIITAGNDTVATLDIDDLSRLMLGYKKAMRAMY